MNCIKVPLTALVFILACQLFAGSEKNPNIIFILVDDMGYSDLGSYGGEIQTPHLDQLAQDGLRFTQMYNTSKCFPSRAALLTGVYAQQCGMAKTYRNGFSNAVTLAEVLKPLGYRTYASGKHHSKESLYDRGFDHYYGLLEGASNMWNPGEQREGEPPPGNKGRGRPFIDDDKKIIPYTPPKGWYATDAFTDRAIGWLDEDKDSEAPFFLYLSYTAPHYPLHAWPEDIAKYSGRYDSGYNAIMKERYERMVVMGLIDPEKTPLTLIEKKKWDSLNPEKRAKEERRMEIYAAMLDRVDQNIGRLLDALEAHGDLDNTLIMFASDNGGCAERSGAKVFSTNIEDFGSVASYETVGKNWATVQNTPMRNWKNYSHEGGINTPFIVNWPSKIQRPGSFYREPAHFIDIMATLVDITGATYPQKFREETIVPMQGVSLLPAFSGKSLERDQPLFFKWGKAGAIRDGHFKAVFVGKKWELFDMANDRNESNDLSSQYPERLAQMQDAFNAWLVSVE
ncbi:MAG: arylsulfatase [Opitutales bacterium]